jgi:tetratricopeptide (TPR) repeat protein
MRGARPEVLIGLLVKIDAWAREHPDSAPASTLLGDAYLQVKQPYAAAKAFRNALRTNPGDSRAREGLGLALLDTNQPEEASKHLGHAHVLDRENAEVLIHWGLALIQTGNLKAAHNRFLRALEQDPGNPHALLNLGLVDTRRGAWLSAIDNFRRAIATKPDFAEAWHNLALACRQAGDLKQALEATTHLTQWHATHAPHWILLAELRLNAGQIEGAEEALRRATELDPANPDIYITTAALYSARRQYGDAEGILTTALALTRDDPNVQLELGHLHLLLGRLDTGWKWHEARKRILQSPVRRFPLPDWQGEDLAGKTVLVHAEQGLGDTILFAHCLPDLLSMADHVVIEVSTRLAPLFARSFPSATVVGREPSDVDLLWLQQQRRSIDFQIPIGSLPLHFRRSASDFPSHNGYLIADPARVAYWKNRLQRYQRPVWGVAWRGGLPQTGREQRSLSLSNLTPVLRDCAVQWISLQYGSGVPEELAVAPIGLDLPHWADVIADQDEVAALTSALDGVLTVCSTQAHLTGALGRPGKVLTPFNPNWRYGIEGNTMPWYPSLTLLRQPAPGDWSAPLSALKDLLIL